MLTSGSGLSGIDVADNDHVDVHLFLTKKERVVSKASIKINLIVRIVAMMVLIEDGC